MLKSNKQKPRYRDLPSDRLIREEVAQSESVGMLVIDLGGSCNCV
jgi:hypothetical protein